MAEPKTEPGFPISRLTAKRPWWAVALLSGVGAGAAIAAALGLASVPARGSEPPPVHTAGIAAPTQTDVEWRAHIDMKLTELGERLARIEGRLERPR